MSRFASASVWFVCAFALASATGEAARTPGAPETLTSQASSGALALPSGVDGVVLARACERNPRGLALAASLAGPRGQGSGRANEPEPGSVEAAASPVALLRSTVDQSPEDVAAIVDLARCYYGQARFSDARDAIAQALLLVRSDPRVKMPAPSVPTPTRRTGGVPAYPAAAQRTGATGIVFVEVSVDSRGTVRRARVVGSVPEFDQLALTAVRQWTFTPPQVAGRAVESTTILRLKFSPGSDLTAADAMDVARFSYARSELVEVERALNLAVLLIDERTAEDERQRRERAAWLAACPSATSDVYDLSRPEATDNVVAPVKISNVAPQYPRIAAVADVSGTVILDAVIDERGDVACSRIVRSVPMLDAAAQTAVRQWRYRPATVDGRAVPVVMTVMVTFTLN